MSVCVSLPTNCKDIVAYTHTHTHTFTFTHIPRHLLGFAIVCVNHTAGVARVADDDVCRGDDGTDGGAAAGILFGDEFVCFSVGVGG